jgi:hypothetical protein
VKARKVDSELARQLRAAGRGGTVEAVVRMQSPPARAAGTGGLAMAVRRLVRRVEQQTGLKASDLHVFANLGAFVVCGPPALVRALLDLDEVAAAVANRRPAPVPVRVPRRRPAAKKPAGPRRARG